MAWNSHHHAGARVLSQAQQALQESHSITELVINVNQLLTDLDAHVFDQECAEQRGLVFTLQGPGFRCPDLALAVGGLGLYGWRAYHSGCL
ncbi:hypothetical protein CMQ_3832 [Grosmannia clavigera kw1407]|uniref:Uncharacterized protein n=1 Tax=Grosmannia clavigera (strain kw1407 / UAMH 11150) TaxID=655863 RepID=F0X9X9_GROCL|nr:uncharacterized protein CMQ_3832 [Grosmannia clavigera kw1407]EFX05763.1 hypothetical protein CMQ_3832 [Grosmannia clavigera kw1407]